MNHQNQQNQGHSSNSSPMMGHHYQQHHQQQQQQQQDQMRMQKPMDPLQRPAAPSSQQHHMQHSANSMSHSNSSQAVNNGPSSNMTQGASIHQQPSHYQHTSHYNSNMYDPSAQDEGSHMTSSQAHHNQQAHGNQHHQRGGQFQPPQNINTARGGSSTGGRSVGTPTTSAYSTYQNQQYPRGHIVTPSTPSGSHIRTPSTPSGNQRQQGGGGYNFSPASNSSSNQYYQQQQQQQQQQYQYPPELTPQSPISAHVTAHIPEAEGNPNALRRLAEPKKSVKSTYISRDGRKITTVSVKKRQVANMTPEEKAQLLARQKQQQGRGSKKRKLNGKSASATATKRKKTTPTTKGKKKEQKSKASSKKSSTPGSMKIPMQPFMPVIQPSPVGMYARNGPQVVSFPKGNTTPTFSGQQQPGQQQHPSFQHQQHHQQPGNVQQQQQHNDSANSLQSSVSPQFHPGVPSNQYQHTQQQQQQQYAHFVTPGTPSGAGSNAFPVPSPQQQHKQGNPAQYFQGGQHTPTSNTTPHSPSQASHHQAMLQQQQQQQQQQQHMQSDKFMHPAQPNISASRKRKIKIDESLHCEVRVTNISDELCANEVHFRQLFAECGDIYRLRIPTLALPFSMSKPKYKGVAYVKYTTLVGADRAIKKFNGEVVSGKKIRVEIFQLPKVAPGTQESIGTQDSRGGQADASEAENTELYVVNLPEEYLRDEATVQRMWEKYGPVVSCAVPKTASGEPNGYIFVKYRYAKDARTALALNDTFHMGKRIQVRFADKKHQNSNTFSGYTPWIFIGGLPPHTSTPDIRQQFSEYGQIEEIDDSQVESKSHAFVKYRSVESVREALKFKWKGIYVRERTNQLDESSVQLVRRDAEDLDEDPDDPRLPVSIAKELYSPRPVHHAYSMYARRPVGAPAAGVPAQHGQQQQQHHHQQPQQPQQQSMPASSGSTQSQNQNSWD